MVGSAAAQYWRARVWGGEAIYLLEKAAIRTRAAIARDVLAAIATHGAMDYAALLARAREGATVRVDDPRALAVLARVVGVVGDANADALVLYAICRTGAIRPPRRVDAILEATLLTEAGRVGEALEIAGALEEQAPLERLCLQANAAHPAGGGAEADWLRHVNALFGADALSAVQLREGEGPRLDRLAAEASAFVDGPLISVLMPVRDAGPEVETAVASVLRQSWRALELIIIDDVSGPEAAARLTRLAASDARVRVLRAPSHRGAYAARNLGLAEARGALITCHDSDDWSHPQKLQRQAEALLGAEGAANASRWVRATPDLELVLFSGSGDYNYANLSSVMIRREALERVGRWDEVRDGADSEFAARIAHVTGAPLQVLEGAPLAFGRVRANSLTHGALWRGWESSARRDYRRFWQARHRREDSTTTAIGDAATACVLVGDFRSPSLMDAVRTAMEQTPGTLALCQVDTVDPDLLGVDALAPEVEALVLEGRLRMIAWEALARFDEAVVFHAPYLEAPSQGGVSAARVRMHGNVDSAALSAWRAALGSARA